MPRIISLLTTLLLPVLLCDCATPPRDEFARRQFYENRLSRLDFPVTRARLYRTLRPDTPARPTGRPGAGLLTGSEEYRLDELFVVELSVVYQAVSGAVDILSPQPTLRGQVRGILDAAQSLDNLLTRGTPEHPADIIRTARILRRPVWR